MDENTLALPKKRKRKLLQNVSCPEIMSNNSDKTKKKKANQNEKKVLKDAQIAAANKVAAEIFQQQEGQSLADTKEHIALLKLEVSQLKQLVKMKDEVIMQLKEKEQEQRMLHSNYDTTHSDLLSSLEAKKSLIHDLEEKSNKLASDKDNIKRELQEIQRKQAISSQKGMEITTIFLHIICAYIITLFTANLASYFEYTNFVAGMSLVFVQKSVCMCVCVLMCVRVCPSPSLLLILCVCACVCPSLSVITVRLTISH